MVTWSKMNKNILIIAGVVFLVSLILSFSLNLRPAVDAAAYDSIAWNLVNGRGYVENINNPLQKDFSIARVGPGYELFLAGVYKIFGHHYQVVWVFQAIFQALIAVFSFLISKRVFGKNWKPMAKTNNSNHQILEIFLIFSNICFFSAAMR